MEKLKYLNDYLHELNALSIMVRLFLAVAAGTAIGIDRGLKGRVAGFKTHSVVCLGAALAMMTGQYIFQEFGQTGDLARLGAQVISGVGFLGVGTIIVTGQHQVKGLTTAASLWASSCIGLALGIGFYSGAFFTCFFIILVFRYLQVIDTYVYAHSTMYELYIELETNKHISAFLENLKTENLKVIGFQLGKARVKGDGVSIQITLKGEKKRNRMQTLHTLSKMEGVRTLEEI